MAVFNVRDFNATGLGLVDEYAAIKAALVACEAAGGGVVYFPAGTYLLGLHDQYSGIRINSGKPIAFAGDGPGATTLRMLGGDYLGRGDFYMLRAEIAHFALRDLTLDGNRANMVNSKEQTHLLQIQNVKRARIFNVEFRDSVSDGIRLLGTGEETFIDDVSIEGCTFSNNGRSGITCQRAFRNTRIHGNHFSGTSDQDIDFEPTGGSGPRRVIITGNTMVRAVPGIAVTLSGVSGIDRVTDVLLSDNVIVGGSVFGTDLATCTIRGNRIDAGPVPHGALTLSRSVENVVVADNIITADGATGTGIAIFSANGRHPTGITISGNRITVAGSIGIKLDSVQHVSVRGNVVDDAGNAGMAGIAVRGTVADNPVRDVVIDGNIVSGFDRGIKLDAGPGSVEAVSVVGNVISHHGVGGKLGIVASQYGAARLTGILIEHNLCGAGIAKPLSGVGFAPVP